MLTVRKTRLGLLLFALRCATWLAGWQFTLGRCGIGSPPPVSTAVCLTSWRQIRQDCLKFKLTHVLLPTLVTNKTGIWISGTSAATSGRSSGTAIVSSGSCTPQSQMEASSACGSVEWCVGQRLSCCCRCCWCQWRCMHAPTTFPGYPKRQKQAQPGACSVPLCDL